MPTTTDARISGKLHLEQLLSEGNILRIRPLGNSMYPLLVSGRDEALIEAVTADACRRNDVLLYRRDQGILVLHRLYKKNAKGFYMVGDNQSELEGPLCSDQILGRLIAVNRNGHEFSVKHPVYRLLSSLWLFMLPARPFCHQLMAWCRKHIHL